MSRRAKRIGMWVSSALFVTLAGAFGWGLIRPASVGSRGVVVATAAGKVEVAWASCALKRQRIAYNMGYSQGNAAIRVGPESSWRPSIARAAVIPAAGLVFRLHVLYVPLWPWALLTGIASVGLWNWAGKVVRPGHCAECGYDLSGLSEGKCPECGGLLARLIRIVLAWRRGWA